MEAIISAEELSKKYTRLRSAVALKDLTDFAVEFTKLHVQQALKQASEKVQITDFGYAVNKDSILNAYNLENIK